MVGGWLWANGGQISLYAAAPGSHLNGCHPRPVNAHDLNDVIPFITVLETFLDEGHEHIPFCRTGRDRTWAVLGWLNPNYSATMGRRQIPRRNWA
jgi:hypothetical protein